MEKKVMPDRLFFDDDILRREAEPCRTLLLSVNLSVVLCFARGRSRDFRLVVEMRRFASVCLESNIKMSIR